MPISSQALYFHLGMDADDDGFIQPKIVMRTLGAGDDDLKVLLAKRFLLSFDTGVVVVKHWLIHNLIQKDRYHATRFQEEKKQLFIKENKAYTENPESVNKMLTQVRLGKDRLLGEVNTSQVVEVKEEAESRSVVKPQKRVAEKQMVYRKFSKTVEPWFYHKQQKEAALRIFDRGLDRLDRGLAVMREHEEDPMCPQASTPFEYEEKLPKLNRYIKKHGL